MCVEKVRMFGAGQSQYRPVRENEYSPIFGGVFLGAFFLCRVGIGKKLEEKHAE